MADETTQTKSYPVVVEADEDGTFIVLPEGWLIEPIGAEVSIAHDPETGAYLAKPWIDEDGAPTCKFVFPEGAS